MLYVAESDFVVVSNAEASVMELQISGLKMSPAE
jgi:hypothetical protein